MRKYLFVLLFALLSAQAMARNFPANTRFARVDAVTSNAVQIDSTWIQAAPGLRIAGQNNVLVFLNQLPAKSWIGFQLDHQGSLMRIWILTANEVAERKLDTGPSIVTFD